MGRVKRHRENKIKKIANTVSIVCLICISIISGYRVVSSMIGYKEDGDTYKKAQKYANTVDFTGNIDFDQLKSQNEDVIGWIYAENTKINYPIVQSHNNKEYLTLKYDKTSGGAGSIFADYRTYDPFNDFNTILYGHHMSDGSMFHDLDKYKDREYAQKHPKMEIITPYKKYHLVITAFLCIKATSDIYTPNPSDRDKYIDMIYDSARYSTNAGMNKNDRIVLLSTCAYEFKNARYVLVGKLEEWSTSDEREVQVSKIMTRNDN